MGDLTEHKITLPILFWRDHVERDLPGGKVVSKTSSEVRLLCTAEDLAEIEADALYYADPHGPDLQAKGLWRSAVETAELIHAYRERHGYELDDMTALRRATRRQSDGSA